MAEYLVKAQALAVKKETTAGTDAAPTWAADAVAVESITVDFEAETVENTEYDASLDRKPGTAGGGKSMVKCTALVKGAGAAAVATPGVLPAWMRMFEGCAMAIDNLAADVTGTVTAPSVNGCTLSTFAGVKRGFVIDVAGQRRVIASITGGGVITVYPAFNPAPTASAPFTVWAGNVVRPISAGQSTLTLWGLSRHVRAGVSKLRRVPGATGTWSIAGGARKPFKCTFDFQGLMLPPEEVADPGAPVLQSAKAVNFISADVFLGGVSTKPGDVTITYGGQVTMPDDPRTAAGYGPGVVSERGLTVKLSPPVGLASVRDLYADWVTGAERDYWQRWGDTRGQRVSIYCPRLVMQDPGKDAESAGFKHEDVNAVPAEADAGIFLFVG